MPAKGGKKMIETLDIIGASLAFISTIFYIRISILAWPISLISLCISLSLYWHKGIYGDMGLHIIYISMSIYGWYAWKFGGRKHSELPISSLTFSLTTKLALIATIGISALYFILSHYTNSQIPLWDATTTILSLIAEWMICRKIIQCWGLWFLMDASFVGIYFFKGLPAHAILNIVYVGMAVAGYWRWQRQIPKTNNMGLSAT